MKCYITLFVFSASLQVWAAQTLTLKNNFNLFSQKLTPGLSLPVAISEKTELDSTIEVPDSTEPTIKKVFAKTFEFQELKTVFEIYFFNQKQQRYLSQQVYLYKDGALITRCTSYFSLEQGYLVPGSCGGVKDDLLYGVAIYK